MLQTKVKGDVVKKYKMWAMLSKGLIDTVEVNLNVFLYWCLRQSQAYCVLRYID